MTGRLSSLAFALLATAAFSLAASSTQAQSCAMLAPGAPPEGTPAPDAAREAANAVVSRQLTEDAITVLPAEEARRRLVDELHAECAQIECGSAVVRSLGVDFAVLVTVWAPGGEPSSVSIALIGPEDSLGGEAPVQGGDVEQAALRALTTAFQRWQASQMGFVEVTSTPSGAEVRIDGRPVGVTPLRRLVMQGDRVVRVQLEGYTAAEQTLQVQPTQSHPASFTLVAAVEELPIAPVTRTEAHWANWLVGGALIAGGAAALVAPIHTLARSGECVEEPAPGLCGSEVQFGAVSGVLLGVSVAALAAGVVFLAAQPITVDVTVQPDAASVRFSGSF